MKNLQSAILSGIESVPSKVLGLAGRGIDHEPAPAPEVVLPEFETEVIDVSLRENYQNRRGDISEFLAEMSDGTFYPVVVGTPKKDKTVSDTAVVFTTAWLTSTKGHNRRTLMHMLEAGYPTIMIGPEGEETNHDISLKDRIKLAANTSLYGISHDMNRILDEVMPALDVRQNEIITLGESRGAMEATGLNVPLYSLDRKAVYGDHIAPCFARQPQLKELGGVLAQLGREAPVLGKLALQIPFQPRGRHYVETIHKNPEYYFKELLKIPKLMSGQAGELAKAARAETPMHIRMYGNDRWSQVEEWEEIYAGRKNVELEVCNGFHLNIADGNNLDNIELRLSAIAEARGFDGSFDKVDFSPITALYKQTRKSAEPETDRPLKIAA